MTLRTQLRTQGKSDLDPPGSPAEIEAFDQLQERLAPLFRRILPDASVPRTVVVVPSLSLDARELAKITGVHHYEERMLCMLMLLRLPRTHVLYLTSQPIDPTIIDYFLHLLPGVPSGHARKRLHLFSCHDTSPSKSLSEKLLARPRLLDRISAAIPDVESAHMVCFNATPLERSLAVRLQTPLYACDPAQSSFGNKSCGREIFREVGIDLPAGLEHLRDEKDIAGALSDLRLQDPAIRRAVVKLNEGFSGEGNALFDFEGAPTGPGLERWVQEMLPSRLRFEAVGETWGAYREKFAQMGGVAERFVEGTEKRSPSAQLRIDPLGTADSISTHDQILGGPTGQVFLGCTFPADEAYRLEVQEAGLKVARALATRGVMGRVGVDFVSTREGGAWKHYALEMNLRKGGTTHPFMMLQFLTDGDYDPDSGLFRTPSGQPRYYRASDNLQDPRYKGLSPEDLIDITVCQRLHFHGASQEGVVFHLIGALSEFGKLGVVSIAGSPEAAGHLYQRTVDVLSREASVATRPARGEPGGST